MTRIIAGVAGGRRLAVPSRGTRPTSDRVREALFSALDHAVGTWRGRHVLDLYAGSGALGLEAASRGASHVLLVERSPAALDVIRANIRAVGVDGVACLRADVERLAAGPPPASARPPYSVVLLDPPYSLPTSAVVGALGGLRDRGWLAAGAVVAIERAATDQVAWPEGFAAVRERRYGDTAVWLGCEAGA